MFLWNWNPQAVNILSPFVPLLIIPPTPLPLLVTLTPCALFQTEW